MGKFQYSLQARMDNVEVGSHNIGIMVWSEDILGYYAVRGEEKHADDMCGRILASRNAGRQIEEFVEYFLTRHGGFFYSMARPETVEAESAEDAVRQAGERWGLDFALPRGVHSVIDREVAERMMDATRFGCEINVRGRHKDGREYRGTDLSFAMQFGDLGDPTIPGYTAVLGYLPFPYSFSHFARGRYWLETLVEIPGGWLGRGRDNWNFDLGDLEIEIRPIRDPEILSAIDAFKASLDDEWREELQSRLKHLGSPMYV